jgi:DNA-3-methyladenine glycosylase
LILQRAFYKKDTVNVARQLLGKILVHESLQGTTAGRIVETEAYCGPEDLAAHSSGGRRTERNEVMYGQKGHAYVYLIYGMYHCVNLTTGNVPAKPEAVLIRALEPVRGEELMANRRGFSAGQVGNLAGGPGRLCIAMGITKVQNKLDLTVPPLYVEDAASISATNIVEATRVGVDYAGQWKKLPWRFYIQGNSCVSVKRKA